MECTSSPSLALAVTMNCELKLGLDWSRSSMVDWGLQVPRTVEPCAECSRDVCLCVYRK
jgi:hypothetical protein